MRQSRALGAAAAPSWALVTSADGTKVYGFPCSDRICPQQRCIVKFVRNMHGHCSRDRRGLVSAALREIFGADAEGRPRALWLCVYEQSEMRTLVDRAVYACGRMVDGYPTQAAMWVPREALVAVGTFDLTSEIVLTGGQSEAAVAEWLEMPRLNPS